MSIVSIFNNKGGVGKSTLTYHLGCALSEQNKKVLMIDLDPQCNLTIFGIDTEQLHKIWEDEDKYIDDYQGNKDILDSTILTNPRSIHFLLKPTEDGESDLEDLPPALSLFPNLDLIPGRLSVHMFENKLSERWNGVYTGDNLAIRSITKIRELCNYYKEKYSYDYILIDTSPSLGILNKTIISTADGFLIPTQPDMFSLYGIKNIGRALSIWKKDFDTIFQLISVKKREKFPKEFVQFLGYTIYNAKKYTSGNNAYDLAQAHYSYVEKIPEYIKNFISEENRKYLNDNEIQTPIGKEAIIHSHNTFPSVAQALHCPMWKVPDEIDNKDRDWLTQNNIKVHQGSYEKYRDTKAKYIRFSKDFLLRANKIGN